MFGVLSLLLYIDDNRYQIIGIDHVHYEHYDIPSGKRVQKTMENHHYKWTVYNSDFSEKKLFSFIVMLAYQRVETSSFRLQGDHGPIHLFSTRPSKKELMGMETAMGIPSQKVPQVAGWLNIIRNLPVLTSFILLKDKIVWQELNFEIL